MDLENFNREGFRQLLNGVSFRDEQLQNLLDKAKATPEEIREHIAALYEAARGAFQAAYTRKNKIFVWVTSFIVVILLNANVISLYNQISADLVVQQTLSGQAQRIEMPQYKEGDLKKVYDEDRKQIGDVLDRYPILLRTPKYKVDFAHPLTAVFGLLMMGVLVSLGAPFWNDVLKSLAQVNNTLGTRWT